MDIEDVMRLVQAECDKAGSASAWARKLGVTRAYMSDILSRRRDPGPKVLDALGLEKVTRVSYEWKSRRGKRGVM
jgi:DNA-binding transcriptional regulator YdaS (Cro superfamily)